MTDISEIVDGVVKPLDTQKAKERAKASATNIKTLLISYIVLSMVVLLQFLGFSIMVVVFIAIAGLAMIGITHWRHGKKMNTVIYQQEIRNLESLVQLTQEKKNNSENIIGAIKALAASVDAKDHYTYGHSEKIAEYTVEIAKELGYSYDNLESIRTAALLHDIGKIGISDQLLRKRGILDRTEWIELRSHPERGAEILQHIDAIKDCVPAVLHHHERYDGSGYPAGLSGESIPLIARIIAVADTFDAITSQRPYRPSKMTHEEAFVELVSGADSQFDRRVVNTFVNIHRSQNKEMAESKRKQNLGTCFIQEKVSVTVDSL
jgi:putative nucleotidyltransferase with HDIG domain